MDTLLTRQDLPGITPLAVSDALHDLDNAWTMLNSMTHLATTPVNRDMKFPAVVELHVFRQAIEKLRSARHKLRRP